MSKVDTIVAGFSDPEAVRAGMVGVDGPLARERAWYADSPRFAAHKDVMGAVACGQLVAVEPIQDPNYRLIGRYRSRPHVPIYPPYLTPQAATTLTELGTRWRAAADELGVPAAVRLSVTSLVRSQEYQALLVAKGKFAVSDSTHTTGNAFDLDLGGYYEDLPDGREACISLREPADQMVIADAFESAFAVERYDPVRLGPEYFDGRVMVALGIAHTALYGEGRINALVEMADTPNRVLHVAAAPAGVNGA